jgi:hypothetical protein
MSFPVIMTHPTFTLTLPASQKKIEFRPFLEKERKILLMALESNVVEDMEKTTKQLIKTCCLTQDIDVDKMPIIDIEYFFLHLRARSIGEILDLSFSCNNITEKGRCGHSFELKVDVNDIKVEGLDPSNKKIQLTPNVGVMMNYPHLIATDKNTDDIEFMYDMAIACIEYVYDSDNVYFAKDYKPEDLYFFVTNLTVDQFKKIQDFINNSPVLRKQIKYKCQKCGFDHEINLEGLQSFFG